MAGLYFAKHGLIFSAKAEDFGGFAGAADLDSLGRAFAESGPWQTEMAR